MKKTYSLYACPFFLSIAIMFCSAHGVEEGQDQSEKSIAPGTPIAPYEQKESPLMMLGGEFNKPNDPRDPRTSNHNNQNDHSEWDDDLDHNNNPTAPQRGGIDQDIQNLEIEDLCSRLSIEDFREAVESNAGAARLILVRHEDDIFIEASHDINNHSDQNENENREIMRLLKDLITARHSSDVANAIAQLSPTAFVSKRDLSATTLNNILQQLPIEASPKPLALTMEDLRQVIKDYPQAGRLIVNDKSEIVPQEKDQDKEKNHAANKQIRDLIKTALRELHSEEEIQKLENKLPSPTTLSKSYPYITSSPFYTSLTSAHLKAVVACSDQLLSKRRPQPSTSTSTTGALITTKFPTSCYIPPTLSIPRLLLSNSSSSRTLTTHKTPSQNKAFKKALRYRIEKALTQLGISTQLAGQVGKSIIPLSLDEKVNKLKQECEECATIMQHLVERRRGWIKSCYDLINDRLKEIRFADHQEMMIRRKSKQQQILKQEALEFFEKIRPEWEQKKNLAELNPSLSAQVAEYADIATAFLSIINNSVFNLSGITDAISKIATKIDKEQMNEEAKSAYQKFLTTAENYKKTEQELENHKNEFQEKYQSVKDFEQNVQNTNETETRRIANLLKPPMKSGFLGWLSQNQALRTWATEIVYELFQYDQGKKNALDAAQKLGKRTPQEVDDMAAAAWTKGIQASHQEVQRLDKKDAAEQQEINRLNQEYQNAKAQEKAAKKKLTVAKKNLDKALQRGGPRNSGQ